MTRLARPVCCAASGEPTEAVRVAGQAMALAPLHGHWIDAVKGMALFHLERFSEALDCFSAARSGGFAYYDVLAYAAAAHSALGQEQKARAELEKVLELEPGFRLEAWPQYTVLRLAQDRDRLERHFLRAAVLA